MSLTADIQRPDLNRSGGRVELFVLDVSALGGAIHRVCSSINEGAPVQWQGNTYSPVPVEMTGFEVSGGGALPTPTLKLSDGFGVFRAMINAYNDLIGAKITRYVTYRKYLDGADEADPLAHFPEDIYYISRKSRQSGVVIEWQCAALMDQQGKKLPGRTLLKDICDQRYRIWDPDTSSFDYTNATCPYTGTNYFDEMGVVCAVEDDFCGQRLTDCILRYGTAALPFRGFPGVSHVRN